MDYTKPTRKTSLKRFDLLHLKREDPLFPSALFDAGTEPEACWMASTTLQDGFAGERISSQIFRSEDEALRAQAGLTDISNDAFPKEIVPVLKPYIEQRIDEGGNSLGVKGIADQESSRAFGILKASGIFGEGASRIDELLGADRIKWLESKFGDNWQCAATFEYCWLNLPHSSAAFAAAAFQFHYYITGDDLSAGYYWRDMEIAASGAEEIATKALERASKAGAGGKARSKAARQQRIHALLKHMEKLVSENPAISRFAVSDVAQAARDDAANEDPQLWRQGANQFLEYLGELRRGDGDAGPDLQKRFELLFPPKPPKRSAPRPRKA